MSPATNSVMGSVPVNRAGIGSAMNDTTRQVGGALGIAVLGTIMNSGYLNKIDGLGEQLPSLTEGTLNDIENSIQGAHIVANHHIDDPNVSQMIIDTADKAFVSGMSDAFLVGCIIMITTALITLFILPSQVRPAQED